MGVGDPLADAETRVERARKHLTELFGVLEGTAEACFAELQIEHDPATGELLRVVEPETLPGPPPLASVLIGETVYNLRAALDYVVYVLASTNTGTDVVGTQFPIESNAGQFDARVTGRLGKKIFPQFLKGVHPDHVQMIRALQPFEGCAWTRVLRDLSNPDKHRQLTILLTESEIDPYFKPSSRPPDDPAVAISLVVGGDVRVAIVFDDGKGNDVVGTLRLLHTSVETAVQLFRVALETFKSAKT